MELKELDEDVLACRICLTKDEDSECLYDEEEELSPAGKLYEELIGVQIGDAAANGGPQFLCNSCGLQMRLFKQLKTKAYKTLDTLQQKYVSARVKEAQQEARAEVVAVTTAVVVEENITPPPPLLLDQIQMKQEIQEELEEQQQKSDKLLLLQEQSSAGSSFNLKHEITAAQTSLLLPQTEFAVDHKFAHLFHKVPAATAQDQLTMSPLPPPPPLTHCNEMALRKELDAVLDQKVNTAEHGYATIVYELLKDVNVEELEEEQHGAVLAPTPPPPPLAAANVIATAVAIEVEDSEAAESLLQEQDLATTDDRGLYFDVHYLDDETYDDELEAAAATLPHENGENQRPAMLRRKAAAAGRRLVLTSGSGCEKKYHCTYCQWEFNTRKALTEHKKTDHPSKYPCSLCAKVMHTAETMRVHMNLHLGAAPYSCELCQKTFKQKVHYKYHIDKHNNVRNFKCDVPSCGKAFITNTDLKTHKRFHSDERPYACDICGKNFLLLQHMKMHRFSHGKKSHRCDICNQIFISPNTLRCHIKSMHNEEPRFQCEFCKKKFRRKHHLHSHYKQHEKGNIRVPTLNSSTASANIMSTNSDCDRLKEEAPLDVDDEEYVDDPLQEFIECSATEIECISVYDVEDEETATTAGGDQDIEDVSDGDDKVQMNNYSDIIEDDGDTDSAFDMALV